MRTGDFRLVIVSVLILSIPISALAQEKEINTLANTLTQSLVKASKKSVAVVDFTDLQGNVTELGRYLAEEVSVALASTGGGIEVVDRTNLKQMMQESRLASTGIIDPATARKLGHIAGVDVLITGTITPFGDSVRFTVKGLDTTTARIITAASTEIPKTRAIEELLNRGVAAEQAPGGGQASTSSSTLPRPNSPAVSTEQFSFALNACERDSASITCHLTITNMGEDRNLELFGRYCCNFDSSRMIDGVGREVLANQVLLGSKRSDSFVIGTLVTGVPTGVEIHFGNIPPDTSTIALIEASFAMGNKAFKVKFRAIPLAVRK